MTERDLIRIERKIDLLLAKEKRPLWVKSPVITGLTGWTKEGMRRARENGYIKWEEREKDGKKSYWYDLNSLDPRMIKQRA